MIILGLAVATSEHHAAALVVDGQIVAAAEEERFNRIKHYGAAHRANGMVNLIASEGLRLSDVMCPRATKFVLEYAGLSLQDVDFIAVNGIPHRWRDSFSPDEPSRPPVVIEEGRYLFIPHHLAHAASAARCGGLRQPQVLTVDGRGERETAAYFEMNDSGELQRLWDVPVQGGHSFGGCYETASRRLGFGPHGQGAVMALAALGVPGAEAHDWMCATSPTNVKILERALGDRLAPIAREPTAPILPAHADAAATLQRALEHSVASLVRHSRGPESTSPLGLAGGVMLNCPLNRAVLEQCGWPHHFIQPAAHDAGTAIGAALEAAWRHGEPACATLESAALGPSFGEDQMEAALRRSGLAYSRFAAPEAEVAFRLADGQIVCRFAGRMEFGPRALGQRSILADPRRAALRVRLNAMKGRAPWRPFGPSILSGTESEWFVDARSSPFMLLTFFVQGERRAEVPVIVHGDGSTRPQSVHPAVLPDYANLLEAFRALTGVPMVVNTSFNRGGEPIVCSPDDAIESFRGLGADALQLGPFIAQGVRS